MVPTFGDSLTFRLYITPPGGDQQDVTFFRDVPVQFNSWSFADPFSEATASITIPKVTVLDRPGTGELSWLTPWSDVDIVAYDSNNHPIGWRWEGVIASEEISDQGLTISCKGALYQADNFLAKPTYPQRPIPYELLIASALDPSNNPSLRTNPLQITWPDDWGTVVPTPADNQLWFLRPWGVVPGQKWTGLTSRSTGTWEPVLTGFVQTLLSVMYTEDGGQWTVRKNPGRAPELLVRPALRQAREDTMTVYAGAHGVQISMSRDFTQSANVVFGSGQDLAGTTFNGQQVTSDGATTFYDPFAALPFVYPASDTNPRFLESIARKETLLQFPQGIDEIAAREIAANQIRKFADPGYTGTITLTSDPLQYGQPFSRFLITAGMTIAVVGLRGATMVFHISQAEISLEQGTTTLTVDSKFRDALTIAEVRARTRDALDPVRLLQVGKYSTTVQDLVKPWSYTAGSGVIPSGGPQDATELFTKLMAPNAQFPWTSWTTQYPPSKYPQYYIRLEPKNANATLNWSGLLRDGVAAAAIPVKLSQTGTIRLSQVAAYDINGNLMPIRFHVGIYGNSGISSDAMPMIPASIAPVNGYGASQRYPFYPGAFEQVKPDGTLQSDPSYLIADQSDQYIAWGNYYEPAGYSPGLFSKGNPKTGMLEDSTPWSFDTSAQPGFDKYSVENTAKNPTAGMGYVLIYADDQGTQPVFFLGRLFVQNPGA